jgi:hypothetical protein
LNIETEEIYKEFATPLFKEKSAKKHETTKNYSNANQHENPGVMGQMRQSNQYN